MSERTKYRPGEFCWVDLASPDLARSKRFYAELFGWVGVDAGTAEGTAGYGYFSSAGKRVAGYGPIQAESQPPVWSSYICVADAEQAAAAVVPAGGVVLIGPFDVSPDAGRMAVFQDPTGAFVSAWQPGSQEGAELVNQHGAWTWNELNTRDLEAAKRFYGDVFGWSAASSQAPDDSGYMLWQVEGQPSGEGIAGLSEVNELWPDEAPSHWMVYFSVDDAEVIAARCKELGGVIAVAPVDIQIGRIAALGDPHGAFFSIIEAGAELVIQR